MFRPSRFIAAALAAAVVTVPSAAAAAPLEGLEQRVESATGLLQLDVFPEALGDPVLRVEDTAAVASRLADGVVAAVGQVDTVQVLGQPVPLAERLALSDGPFVVDPQSGDDECALPVNDLVGLELGLVCSLASAEADEFGADAIIDVAGIEVGGEVLSDLLSGALVEDLDAILEDLGLELVSAAITDLDAICDTPLGDLLDLVDGTTDGLVGDLGDLGGLDLIDTVTDVGDLGGTVEDILSLGDTSLFSAQAEGDEPSSANLTFDELSLSCQAIVGLLDTENPGAGLLDASLLADALDDLDLFSLTLDDASATSVVEGDILTATGAQPVLQVAGPSLDAIDAIVEGLLDTALTGLVGEIDATIGGVLGESVAQVQALLDEITAQLPIFSDSAPLITAVVGDGDAIASIDQATGDLSASTEQVLARIAIAPSIIELLGGDPADATIEVAEGGEQTIAEGTPLESFVSLGTSSVEDATRELSDGTVLEGIRSTAGVVRLDLLQGVLGGIGLDLGGVTAASFAGTVAPESPTTPAPGPDTPESPELPSTGGGAAALAIAALLGAGALRRRR